MLIPYRVPISVKFSISLSKHHSFGYFCRISERERKRVTTNQIWYCSMTPIGTFPCHKLLVTCFTAFLFTFYKAAKYLLISPCYVRPSPHSHPIHCSGRTLTAFFMVSAQNNCSQIGPSATSRGNLCLALPYFP